MIGSSTFIVESNIFRNVILFLIFVFLSGCGNLCHQDGEIIIEILDQFVIKNRYPLHIQGADVDRENNQIVFCFTDRLVFTDFKGNILREFVLDAHDFPNSAIHIGDIAINAGRLYLPYSIIFNFSNEQESKNAKMYVYQIDTMELEAAYHLHPDIVWGAGAVEFFKGFFWVSGGLAPTETRNYIYQYDAAFRLIAKKNVESGYTTAGIQTLFANPDSTLNEIYAGTSEPNTIKIRLNELLTTKGPHILDLSTHKGAFFYGNELYRITGTYDSGLKLNGAIVEKIKNKLL